MPEIFRFLGSHSSFIAPIHVHVEGNDGYAVFDLVGDGFVLREERGIKSNDLKKIQGVIDENKDIIINRWKEHFDK